MTAAGSEVFPADGNGAGTAIGHQQQNGEADQLENGRGNGRPGGAQLQAENQDRVQHDIQQTAAGDADHAVGGKTLEAKQVVHGVGEGDIMKGRRRRYTRHRSRA